MVEATSATSTGVVDTISTVVLGTFSITASIVLLATGGVLLGEIIFSIICCRVLVAASATGGVELGADVKSSELVGVLVT